jgi:hypothetical protein
MLQPPAKVDVASVVNARAAPVGDGVRPPAALVLSSPPPSNARRLIPISQQTG